MGKDFRPGIQFETGAEVTAVLITHADCLRHDPGPGHPERPERLSTLIDHLHGSGLIRHLDQCEAPEATREQLCRVHDPDYVARIFATAPDHGERIWLDADTSMSEYSLGAALRSAGAAVEAVDRVLNGRHKTAFCAVRPPGHHAGRSSAMGFCIFNNVAVGAAHALVHHGIARVAIVDFDVHHGNGTEEIFTDEERVLLCSSFQHPFYPYSGAHTFSDHLISIPLPAGTSGEMFRCRLTESGLPRLKAFQPQLIFLSAGFDAHKDDPLGGLCWNESDYAWVTEQIMAVADRACHGRVVSVLEGGYAPAALGRSVVAHLTALTGLR